MLKFGSCTAHDGVSVMPSAPKHSASGPACESSCRHTVDATSGVVFSLVMEIDAATPVWPTTTVVGNVGATDRRAPAAAGLDGRRVAPNTMASVVRTRVHQRRF